MPVKACCVFARKQGDLGEICFFVSRGKSGRKPHSAEGLLLSERSCRETVSRADAWGHSGGLTLLLLIGFKRRSDRVVVKSLSFTPHRPECESSPSLSV